MSTKRMFTSFKKDKRETNVYNPFPKFSIPLIASAATGCDMSSAASGQISLMMCSYGVKVQPGRNSRRLLEETLLMREVPEGQAQEVTV